MSEQEIRDMRKLDELADMAGGFVAQASNPQVHYDYRGISEYCKKKGIEPMDLTVRELSQYIIEQ